MVKSGGPLYLCLPPCPPWPQALSIGACFGSRLDRWQYGPPTPPSPQLAGAGASPLPLVDKLLPRKRSMIEPLLAKLKRGTGLEHSRHRSPINAFPHTPDFP